MRAIFSPLFRSLWQELSSTGFIISCQLFCYGCGWRKWQHSQGHGEDTCKTFWDMCALCIVFTRCTRSVLSLDHQFFLGHGIFAVWSTNSDFQVYLVAGDQGFRISFASLKRALTFYIFVKGQVKAVSGLVTRTLELQLIYWPGRERIFFLEVFNSIHSLMTIVENSYT
jgi:hypothetical protein